jgi:hypothetical protein
MPLEFELVDLHGPRSGRASRFHGVSMREIAKTLAWEEESVGAMWAVRPRSKLKSGNWRSGNEQILQTTNETASPISAKCWSGRRESNPRMQLGKLPFYH